MISGKKRDVDPQFPWKPMWRPPGATCPKCKSGAISYTAQRDAHGNHVYKCFSCSADFASFTIYAYCHHFERLLEKDELYTPCFGGGIQCIEFESVGPQNMLRCEHFEPVNENVMDEKDVRRIEASMKNFRKPKHQVSAAAMGASGVGKEVLDRARKERLRRLQEEGV